MEAYAVIRVGTFLTTPSMDFFLLFLIWFDFSIFKFLFFSFNASNRVQSRPLSSILVQSIQSVKKWFFLIAYFCNQKSFTLRNKN